MSKKERNEFLRGRPLESRAVVRARAERFKWVANDIFKGLEGKPFSWKGSENHWVFVAEQMGLTLISESRAKSIGLVLKQRQRPVGTIYYGAPLSRYVAVYVLECQFNREAASASEK